jgi:hypothetical protein
MYKNLLKLVLWSCAILALSVSTTEICSAHNNFPHRHNGRWHSHPHNSYHYHNNVVYYPHVQWFSYGTNLNVGPIIVSPDRRYVRVGIGVGFSSYQGFHTFNYRTGQSRWYPHNRY